MTTIVGIQGDGWSVIASDSMINSDSQPFYSQGMEKCFTKGEYNLAIAGDAVAIDVAKYLWNPPRATKVVDLDKFLTTKVLTSLKASCALAGYDAQKEKEKDSEAGFEGLLSIRGIIYQISSEDFAWLKDSQGLYAIGSGGQIALGALAAFNPSKKNIASAVSAAKAALQISIQYNLYTGGEIQTIIQEK